MKIAADERQRPRYEPYGIAVTKNWLYKQGGRPVIYDNNESYNKLPDDMKYRWVHYDPSLGVDYTWEREWRICTDSLILDPKQTLVVVPDATTAFQIVYGHAEEKPDFDYSDGQAWVAGVYHEPKWLAVSLDLFGLTNADLEGSSDTSKKIS